MNINSSNSAPDSSTDFFGKVYFWVFAGLWSVLILSIYINRHSEHWIGIGAHKYFPLILSGIGLIGVLAWLQYRSAKLTKYLSSGIAYLIYGVLFTALILFWHFYAKGDSLSTSHVLYALGRFMTTVVLSASIFMSCYLLGDRLIDRYFADYQLSGLVALALGLFLFCQVLFALAAASLFQWWSIFALILIPYLLSFKRLSGLVKQFFTKDILTGCPNHYGLRFVVLLVLFYICINYISMLGPFPLGFDSRNHYFNIAMLIADGGTVLPGFSSYPWSLVMAAGVKISGFKSMALVLAFAPIVLVAFYIFKILTDRLSVSGLLAATASLCFVSLPAVTNHLFVELKIDIALLFIQLALLDLILSLWHSTDVKLADTPSLWRARSSKLIWLISLLSGYALTIKFTHSFMIFALLCVMWSWWHRIWGFIAMFCISVAMVLLMRIDSISGLDQYHLSRHIVVVFLALAAIYSLVYITYFRKEIKMLRKAVLSTVLIAAIHLLVISPWMVKNYLDSDRISPTSLLMGKENSLKINLSKLKKNYKKSQKGK